MEKITAEIKTNNGIPESWKDTMEMQAMYSLEEKGYRKKLTWKASTIDPNFAGAFADEFIKEDELIRFLEKDKNMLLFQSKDDLPPHLTKASIQYLAGYIGNTGDLCRLFIPGLSANHHETQANIWLKKISDHIVHITARRDIHKGEELFHDYSLNGNPPLWLADFAKEHNVFMNYKGYCDFV